MANAIDDDDGGGGDVWPFIDMRSKTDDGDG